MRRLLNKRLLAGMRSIVVLPFLYVGGKDGQAAQRVYRCQLHGQTVLTDQPCPVSKPSDFNSVVVPSLRAPSTVGRWQGQMQYSGTEAGEEIEPAHSVALLDIEFTSDGKISGGSPDNGCHWLGVWSQGGKGVERIITLDLATNHCQFAGLNRRYTGTFLLGVPDSSGQVQMAAYSIPSSGQKARSYRIGGTLRRP